MSGQEKRHHRLLAGYLKRVCRTPEDESARLVIHKHFVEHVRGKKQFDNIFHARSLLVKYIEENEVLKPHSELLLLAFKKKDVLVPNKALDAVLTALYGLVTLWSFVAVWRDPSMLVMFIASLFAIVPGVVWLVRNTAAAVGAWISDAVVAWRFVESPAPLSSKKNMKKWEEQSWQFVVHVSMTIWELCILYSEDWWEDPELAWRPFHGNQHFSLSIRAFYCAQLAIWLYTCFVHRFFDERRKDYFEMYIHHIVTIALIAGSASQGYLRIGLLVVFIHDASDILVDSLKLINYLKLEGTQGFFASEIIFFLNLITWVYFRMYNYPLRVLRSSFFGAYHISVDESRKYATPWGISEVPIWNLMNLLLAVLLLLHIMWFCLFIRILYMIFTENVREASRTEYEGDSEDEDALPTHVKDTKKIR